MRLIKEEDIDLYAPAFDLANKFTGLIQIKMSKEILTNEASKRDLDEQLSKSENEMQHRINKAVYAFVGAMPLATENNINLFFEVLSLYSNITGDSTMHEMIQKLNNLTYGEH